MSASKNIFVLLGEIQASKILANNSKLAFNRIRFSGSLIKKSSTFASGKLLSAGEFSTRIQVMMSVASFYAGYEESELTSDDLYYLEEAQRAYKYFVGGGCTRFLHD